MNKDEKIDIISKYIFNIFDVKDDLINQIKEKIIELDNENLDNIIKYITEFQNKQDSSNKQLLQKLWLASINLDEFWEKKEFEKEEKDFFKDL